MLELPNFDRMTTSTIKFESQDKALLVTSWTKLSKFLERPLFLEGLE